MSVGLSETTSLTKTEAFSSTGTDAEKPIKASMEPLNAMQKFSASSDIKVAQGSEKMDDIKAKIFEVDGNKFLVQNGLSDDQIKSLGSDVTVIKVSDSSKTAVATATDAKAIAADIQRVTGFETKAYTDTITSTSAEGKAQINQYDIAFTKNTLSLSGKSLELQIGDTSDKFNKLSVTVGDMHSTALGLAVLDISTQEGASAGLDSIKAAVNQVSDTRGSLGALQNRLDHTINNLGVMRENIQNAESTIRDTDVAEEMMTYTKNSILNQSAQAMLAQANQLPQGVLQLLQ